MNSTYRQVDLIQQESQSTAFLHGVWSGFLPKLLPCLPSVMDYYLEI